MRIPFAVVAVLVLLLAGCNSPASDKGDEGKDGASIDLTAPALRHLVGEGDLPRVSVASNVTGLLRGLDHGVSEPTLAVAPDGTILVAAFSGNPDILRTRDGGFSWQEVSPRVAGQRTHPVSFDPMVYVDPGTGRTFDIDQQGAVGCYQVSYSDDLGDSWTGPFPACNKPVVDHQTIVAAAPRALTTVAYPNVLFVCYNIIVTAECIRSLNGGISWTATTPVLSPGADAGGDQGAQVCSSLTGHLAAAADGTVYLPRRACDATYVIITRDDGLSWEVVPIGGDQRAIGGTGISGPDPAVTVDAEGNVYYSYVRLDGHLVLSVSTDQGRTWSTPVDVTRPGVTATNLPKIVVGDPGRVAFAYYGTTAEGGFDAKEGAAENRTWDLYLAVATQALGPTPEVVSVRLNDPADPAVRGTCGPGRCPGGILDFIDIEVDAEGRPWAVFTDACVDDCAKPDGDATLSNGDAGLLATLATGPSLRAAVGTLPPLA
jgi:hypothetical protein